MVTAYAGMCELFLNENAFDEEEREFKNIVIKSPAVVEEFMDNMELLLISVATEDSLSLEDFPPIERLRPESDNASKEPSSTDVKKSDVTTVEDVEIKKGGKDPNDNTMYNKDAKKKKRKMKKIDPALLGFSYTVAAYKPTHWREEDEEKEVRDDNINGDESDLVANENHHEDDTYYHSYYDEYEHTWYDEEDINQELCFENTDVNFDDDLDQTTFQLVDRLRHATSKFDKRIRNRRKHRTRRASLQIKTKYCRSVHNKAQGHGIKLNVNHRVAKRMPMGMNNGVVAPRTEMNTKAIDGRATVARQPRKQRHKLPQRDFVVNDRHAHQSPRPVIINRNQKPVKTPKHAVQNTRQVDPNLDRAIAQLLLDLQSRDITPEDYDLLLRMDERVKPKTVEMSTIENLRCWELDAALAEDCAICMDDLSQGHLVRELPCKHVFHKDCVDKWLSNSSQNCPLDGVPITT